MNHLHRNINCVPKYNTVCEELEENGELLFALFDFDHGLLLSIKESSGYLVARSPCPPFEVRYAYAIFDPFKYDVACFGVHFSEAFWVCALLLIAGYQFISW